MTCPTCGSENYKEYPIEKKLEDGSVLKFDLFICYDCPSYEARNYHRVKQ